MLLLLVFRKFLEPSKRFAPKMNDSVCDGFVIPS